MEPPPHVAAASSRRVLGERYRLERRIATGGTAEVWDAHDTRLSRRVAVKLLHQHLATDESVRTRFHQEGIAAARLHHPSIVRVFDTCSDDDAEALVMEHVEGGTLRELLAGGPLPSELVAAMGAVVADALHHAHRSGMVHRDVKPSNILLSRDGRVLLADLGIAKLDDGADLTRTDHQLLGTARYLAPEQVEGGPVDARTDVYSLGLVLYEAVCGRAPFAGESDVAVALQRLRHDPLPPRQVRAEVDRQLDAVIMGALARDPDGRPRSAGDLRAELLAVPGAASINVAATVAELRRARGEEAGAPSPAASGADPTVGFGEPTSMGAPGPPDRATTPSFQETERRWLVPAVLIVVVAAALGTAAVLFSTTGVGRDLFPAIRDAVTGTQRTPIAVAGAAAFDPAGDGHEHDDTAALVFDDDPSTAWTTEGYRQRRLGTKPGVGLVVTLEAERRLEQLLLRTTRTDWSAEIYVAARPAATLAAWGDPVGLLRGAGTEERVDLAGRRGSAILIWITDLGEAGPPFRFELNEVAVSR